MPTTDEQRDPENGQFLPGNRFWEARSTHGRKPIFETAEQLSDACEQYFDWVEKNPLYAGQVVSFQGKGTIVPVPKMRAMTIGGLCLFIGITFETWNEWRKSRPDFSEVMRAAEQTIRQQKFEGAAAELLSANIIARDLGLADRNEHTGASGGPIQMEHISARELIASKLDGLAASATKAGDTGEPE